MPCSCFLSARAICGRSQPHDSVHLVLEYLEFDLNQLVIVEDGVGGHDSFGGIELGVGEPFAKGLLDALIVQVHVGGSLKLSQAYTGAEVEEFVRKLGAVQGLVIPPKPEIVGAAQPSCAKLSHLRDGRG